MFKGILIDLLTEGSIKMIKFIADKRYLIKGVFSDQEREEIFQNIHYSKILNSKYEYKYFILNRLVEAGDSTALKFLKEEIYSTLKKGYSSDGRNLIEEEYVKDYLPKDKLEEIVTGCVKLHGEAIPVISNILYIHKRVVRNLLDIKGLFKLDSLRALIIDNCFLEKIPESIGKFESLEFLGLSRNLLTSLPETIRNLTSLKTLYLGHNRITSLPDTIGNLTSLRDLSLGDNNLETLPKTIGKLTSLKRLWLNYNQLSSLPETIGSLTSLKFLNLNDNNLKNLPDSIGNLESLRKVDLRKNNITNLPNSLRRIKFLEIDL
jgi:hypothetical protein